MTTLSTVALGLLFVALGTANMFLMFHLWGYPFDKATRTSAAPRWLMRVHRIIGYAFGAIYVVMMTQMVPRLVAYQVEFPPRTVAHIILAITLGFLLIVKIAIMRFFRHLEEWMPYLGTGMVLCSYLLVGLSVPAAFRQRQLEKRALGGEVTSAANLERVSKLLPSAGLPKDAPIDQMATAKNVALGRDVLVHECVQCHDLKTILARPRTPKDWVQTVARMADKPILGEAITDKKQWAVAAYLIAITPELQESAKRARVQKAQAKEDRVAGVVAMESPSSDEPLDMAKAKPLFDEKCTQCHELDDVERHAWKGSGDVKDVVERMLDNGLEATPEELETLRGYLMQVYVKGPPPSEARSDGQTPAEAPPPTAAVAKNPAAPQAKAPRPTAQEGARTPTPGDTGGAPPATTATAKEVAPTAATEGAPPACGQKGQPPCPLQAWMKANAAGASAAENGAALAGAFERIARFAPPGYAGWVQSCNDGASAARTGDIKGARAACSACHNQYRAKYKAEMRSRPLP